MAGKQRKNSEVSLANLTPFQKGVSGNKNGRPLGTKNRSTVVQIVLDALVQYPEDIYQELKKVFPGLNKRMRVEDMMTIAMADRVIRRGDPVAYEKLMDSRYGKQRANIIPDDNPEDIEYVVIKTSPADLKNDVME